MIFVTLGTQDKSFKRLLKAVEREKLNGNIKEKVIVQAGYTKYKSEVMEIFDTIPKDEFEEYMAKASLVITHGGVGSILTALDNNKKVIAVPRLARYKEHTNDHQKQIVDEFEKNGYILALRDTSKLGDVLKSVKKFTPKKYESNKKNFQKIITDYIDETNHISWYNRDKKIILIELINYLVFAFLFKYNYLLGLLLGFILSIVLCLFLYNHKKENISYLVITFLIECISLSLVKDKLFLKTIINPLIIIIYHLIVSDRCEMSY